ncbi:MAG: DoxX family protein [Pseudomonadota bacterium]
MTTRILSYILAALFIASGGAKLASLPLEVEAFARWGYAPVFMYVIGVLEVAGAVGLLIPRLSALASLCLAGIMVGAVATHAIHAEWPMLGLALAILAAAAWRSWRGRADIVLLGSAWIRRDS